MKNSKIKIQNYNLKLSSIILIVAGCGIILNFYGCATAPLVMPPAGPAGIPGIYHRVEKGQTLWRISKLYDADLDELARVNRIPEASNIEIGQLIFVPHASTIKIPATAAGEDFIWPVRGRVIAAFNQTYNNMINKGINIQPYGNFNVSASRSGKVVFSSPNFKGFGRTVILEHPDGFLTVYARNSEIFARLGDNVRRGEVIAKAGSPARDKPGYLHFEIRKGHIPQNPRFYLP